MTMLLVCSAASFGGTRALAASPSVVSIAAGGNHTCALFSGGTIECWGENEDGELGNGTKSSSPRPIPVNGITNAIQVSVGWANTCAILAGGTVECWGDNTYGQLSNSTVKESSIPVEVGGITGASQISVGFGHACAILAGGTVECWGDNSDGQLGDGTTRNSPTPVRVSGITSALAVTTADVHSCALLSGGTIECWGSNSSDQLGDEIESHGQKSRDGHDISSTPVQVSGITNATQISAGGIHTCALLGDQRVECWGGDFGMRPNVIENDDSTPLSSVTVVSSGERHSCVVAAGGAVSCWGGYSYGPATLNDEYWSTDTPLAVDDLSGVATLALGDSHSCALRDDDEIVCWGGDSNGQLGNGKMADRVPPVTVKGIGNARQISAAGHFACALLRNGRAECWGVNRSGQLGSGNDENSFVPTRVRRLGKAAHISTAGAIDYDRGHTCAVVSHGRLECWGGGPLPAGRANARGGSYLPVPLKGINDAVQLSGWGGRNGMNWCAVLRSGRLECWRSFLRGLPVITKRLGGVVSVGVGDGRVCAVLRNGKVECWGSGTCHQLGNCTKLRRQHQIYKVRTPLALSGIRNARMVASGDDYSCAVLSTGRIKCWGLNGFGQLGAGSTAGRKQPLLVKGIKNAVAVSAGSYFACALLRSGKVMCWGSNGDGELGDGLYHLVKGTGCQFRNCDFSRTPVKVKGIANARAINAGDLHACANLTNGRIKCWGFDSYGELGDGGHLIYEEPVGVVGFS